MSHENSTTSPTTPTAVITVDGCAYVPHSTADALLARASLHAGFAGGLVLSVQDVTFSLDEDAIDRVEAVTRLHGLIFGLQAAVDSIQTLVTELPQSPCLEPPPKKEPEPVDPALQAVLNDATDRFLVELRQIRAAHAQGADKQPTALTS